MSHYCLECNCHISIDEFRYSTNKYGIPLCYNHQRWIDDVSREATFEAIRLYFALKQRGVPAQIEKFDGHKHIDIVIEEAKTHIEVDGGHHNYDTRQALSDLKRTFFSFLDGYFTLRIPNSLVYNDSVLNETADWIVEILIEGRNRAKM